MSSDTPIRDFPSSASEYAGKREGAAEAARDSLAEDVSSLRADMTKLHDMLSKFCFGSGWAGCENRAQRRSGGRVTSRIDGHRPGQHQR
jgi:hypothetical protein